MELKPAKGIKVKVNAKREAVFGEEGVSMDKVAIADGQRSGVMTGMTLAGFAEVEMPKLDGGKHWYPVVELAGEHGESIIEDEVEIDEGEDDAAE